MLKSQDKLQNNYLKNKGFTLIEILVVLAIIGVIMGISTVGLKSLSTSPQKIFSEKLKTSINTVKNFSKNYNLESKILFDDKKKQVVFYFLNAKNGNWQLNTKIPALHFQNVEFLDSMTDIIIKPNGYISRKELTISTKEEQIILNLDNKNNKL